MSDSSAAVHDAEGLDVARCASTRTTPGSLADPPSGDEITAAELLALDVDVLVPAALEGAIHGDNAGDVRASVILEVANGPVTGDADEILTAAGVEIVPDILANAGGVTVSWFEWIQGRTGDTWTAEAVAERLEERMVAQTELVAQVADDRDLPLVTAAYVVALERLGRGVRGAGHRADLQRRRRLDGRAPHGRRPSRDAVAGPVCRSRSWGPGDRRSRARPPGRRAAGCATTRRTR